jgi:hypothetical protein
MTPTGNGGGADLDPTVLAELSTHCLWIVDNEDDCDRLRPCGFRATWLNPGERLTKRCLGGAKHVIVLQRPGPDGAAFGLKVREQLDALRWKGELTRAPLPDPYFDLAILDRETAGDRISFTVFIADCAAYGVSEMLPQPKAPSHAEASALPLAADQPLGLPIALGDVLTVFQKWLYLKDPGTIEFILGALAANLIGADPVWVLIVGPTGGGKTEPLQALNRIPHVVFVSTMSEAGLLSGTPAKERAVDAHGGLLRRLGEDGTLICKDFTSILQMRHEARNQVLAALRDIYDGKYDRSIGSEGGRTLTWKGKMGFLAACTETIDNHHGVMAIMGQRFVLWRLPKVDAKAQGARALDNLWDGTKMRDELAVPVARFFAGLKLGEQPRPDFSPDARERLVELAILTAQCRSAVERDPYRRDIELIHETEAPARLVKNFGLLYAGMQAIGVEASRRWDHLQKAARDTIPKIRWQILQILFAATEPMETSKVAAALGYPTQTTRRALEDLAAHQVVERQKGKGQRDIWGGNGDVYARYTKVFSPIPENYVDPISSQEKISLKEDRNSMSSYFSGTNVNTQ